MRQVKVNWDYLDGASEPHLSSENLGGHYEQVIPYAIWIKFCRARDEYWRLIGEMQQMRPMQSGRCAWPKEYCIGLHKD